MLYFLLVVFELVLLFFMSKKLQRRIGLNLIRLTRNRKITIYIMAVLFLPGTFVHEISHFLAALFLLVPVGNMELIPKIEEDGIKLGSVGIGKTDPLRRFLIGAAPFFMGTVLILATVYFIFGYFYPFSSPLGLEEILVLLFGIYFVFTVSNSMFSSKKDMEGMWGFLAIVILLLVLLWLAGVRISFTFLEGKFISDFLMTAVVILLVPIVLDIIGLVFLPKK